MGLEGVVIGPEPMKKKERLQNCKMLTPLSHFKKNIKHSSNNQKKLLKLQLTPALKNCGLKTHQAEI